MGNINNEIPQNTALNAVDKDNKSPNVPNLRFKDFNGNWKNSTLSQYSKKITKKNLDGKIKNIICNSAQNGLIPQLDFFDKEIVNDNNTENYFIINKGDFVYNPRKSLLAPYGPVNLYKYENAGIVSPLYLCFNVFDIEMDFLLYRFKSPCWYRYIYLNGDSGARHDRVSIKDDTFLNQPIFFPSKFEQKKISSFMVQIDKRIETQSKIISVLQSQMKAINTNMISQISETIKVKDICEFQRKTNRQSGDGLEFGKYPFFTNEEETQKYLDEYDFDGEYIIANTGGRANFKYFNGKFASMSDCLIIKIKDQSLTQFYLSVFDALQEKINNVGFEGSGLRHLNKEWLLDLHIPKYSDSCKGFVKLLSYIKNKIQIEKDTLELYKQQKTYLLRNLFI